MNVSSYITRKINNKEEHTATTTILYRVSRRRFLNMAYFMYWSLSQPTIK